MGQVPMTDPTLDWPRSEMEDARGRCEAATEGPWWWERLDADVVVRAKDPPNAYRERQDTASQKDTP